MKFDFTKFSILFVILSTIGFGIWYFGGLGIFDRFDQSKERVKQLESDYKKLEEEKKIAMETIAIWQDLYKKIDEKDKRMEKEIILAKTDARIARANAEKAKLELLEIKNNMSETRKEIEELKKNTKILTDDELLNDLIKNTEVKVEEPVKSNTDVVVTEEKEIKHKVLARETLYSLSKRYNLTIQELIDQNKFLSKGLQTGQTLIIKTK